MNYERKITVEKLPHEETIDKQTYIINMKDLNRYKYNPVITVIDKLLRRKSYIVIFRDGETEPLKAKGVEVTPGIIDAVDRSRAIKRMFSELFEGGGNLKTIFLIIAGIAVAVFILNFMGVIDFVT